MARISSAAYVTAVLRFLQAFNANDLDACEQLLDKDIEWHGVVDYHGREGVRQMLESFHERFQRPQARPDDFRESNGNVLMVVCFYEDDPGDAPPRQERQSWIATMSDEGLVRRVIAYPSPADAARALEALTDAAPNVPA